MTEKEIFEKNLELSNEFSKYLLNHPELEDNIPPDALIIFVLEDNPELSQHNIEVGRNNRQPNQPVIYVKIKGLRPVEETRLIDPHLESAANM